MAPLGRALEIRARPQLANGVGAAGVPWRGGKAGAKARAITGLRKLGKRVFFFFCVAGGGETQAVLLC